LRHGELRVKGGCRLLIGGIGGDLIDELHWLRGRRLVVLVPLSLRYVLVVLLRLLPTCLKDGVAH
jgi:hypothetical protein